MSCNAVYKITVADADIAFLCEGEETILDAAERAGFSLPYSCRKGICSTCEGTLLSGEVQVSKREIVRGPQGRLRFCVVRPSSHLRIRPQRITRLDTRGRKRLTATVYRITQAPNVAVVDLRLPIGVRAKFRAGQYLRVYLETGDSRNYSMANPPQMNDGVQLHIGRIPGGQFSDAVLAQTDKGKELSIELPYGQFSLNEDSDLPVIMIATGTGFAPFKSMIEDQIAKQRNRRIELYWGARRCSDLYLPELAKAWATRVSWLFFIPVLSQPDQTWVGRTGYVHRAVLDDHPDLRGWEIYACGNPKMVQDARAEFITQAGLKAERFYCESFVPTGDNEQEILRPEAAE